MDDQDFSHFSMLDLFCVEVKNQVGILNNCLLALEVNPDATEELTSLMRAAHSIKGAARIVQVDAAIAIAHGMEDCFVAAQAGTLTLTEHHIDTLLRSSDMLLHIAKSITTHPDHPITEADEQVQAIVLALTAILHTASTASASAPNPSYSKRKPRQENGASISPLSTQTVAAPTADGPAPGLIPDAQVAAAIAAETVATLDPEEPSAERIVRVSVENLNRLMGLAGETLVEANWLQPFADSLLKLKARQAELATILEKLQDALPPDTLNQHVGDQVQTARQKASECYQMLGDRQTELELFSRRSANLADRLYQEVIASHMCPFGEGGQGFPRMVRDLARQLGKQIKLEIIGKSTTVDRDILERLEAPLTHILRNAIDHGIESPQERLALGKPVQGTIRIEAAHRAGMLAIAISDDGRGIHFDALRQTIAAKQLTTADMAAQLTEAELMDFLFLPGFSTAGTVTEVSGRGVGLDAAYSMIREVGGSIRAISHPGEGTTFYLHLPLTLSVIRALLVDISGEPYALPLTRIDQVMLLPQTAVSMTENRPYFTLDGEPIGLVLAQQVLQLPRSRPDSTGESTIPTGKLATIVISETANSAVRSHDSVRYGLVVDRFLGERNLVVRRLDRRLGKVPNISAAALMEDGSPLLIIDTDDLVRSIDKLLASGQIDHVNQPHPGSFTVDRKRILVVDDSITVREMERKLLQNRGYEVEVAVNGMEGWHAVRSGKYDLVITDVDMPRMNGIELVNHIKTNASLKSLPVIIVSYKDRENNRIRGLEAGANYYLTKSSFHDDTLVEAVIDLIGKG